jgi:hypothetical protein
MPRKRNPSWFKPGPDARRMGRPKGSGNKIPPMLVQALVAAATKHGRNGKGLGGFQGYLDLLREEHGFTFPDPVIPPPKRATGRPARTLNGGYTELLNGRSSS